MSQPQIVCRVCQSQQDNAWDCAVCGSPLHDKPRHWAVPVETVEGLEPTRLEDGGNVALEQVPGFEPTSADDGVEPLPDEMVGLELTAFAPEPVLAAEPVVGFEATAIDTVQESLAPATIGCRYCGTPWQPAAGILCTRCGMRVAPASYRDEGAETDRATCEGCGLPEQPVGQICRSCQQPVRARTS